MAELCKRDNVSVFYFILPPYALTSISIFSIPLSVYFLWYWQGELIKKSKFVRVTIIFLYSSIFLRCAWWNNSRKRGRWIDSSDFNWYTFVGGNFKTVSNNYFIIVLRQVILLPLYHGVSEFPLFQSLLRLGWGCRNPWFQGLYFTIFFVEKMFTIAATAFIVLLFDIETFHRIFSDWGITQGVDSPAIFSQGRSKKTLRRSKGDIGATMNIFISVTPDTRCSLTCFHGHLLHAVVISPPHPFY